MKFPAFHHRKFQTQLFSLKPMTSSCHVRIVNEIDKRASQTLFPAAASVAITREELEGEEEA